MKRLCFGLLLLLLLVCPPPAAAQETAPVVVITSPRAGEALQGVVAITGASAVDGFQSAEVAFAYSDDPTGTWFLIQASGQPVVDGALATWDTTALTDGVYTLRLRVMRAGGSALEATVTGLRLRNYSPVETPTPLPATATPLAQPTLQPLLPTAITETVTPYPTPTFLPANPAALTPADVYADLGRGALVALLLFAAFGFVIWLRRK